MDDLTIAVSNLDEIPHVMNGLREASEVAGLSCKPHSCAEARAFSLFRGTHGASMANKGMQRVLAMNETVTAPEHTGTHGTQQGHQTDAQERN